MSREYKYKPQQQQPQKYSVPFPLANDEKLIECPYYPNHKVLDTKFHIHVKKCRLQHIKERQLKNQKPEFTVCNYTAVHHIRNELLEEHHRTCPVGKSFNEAMLEFKVNPLPAPNIRPLPEYRKAEDHAEEDWESSNSTATFDFKKRQKEMALQKQPNGLTKTEKRDRMEKIEEMRHPRAQLLADDEWKAVQEEVARDAQIDTMTAKMKEDQKIAADYLKSNDGYQWQW